MSLIRGQDVKILVFVDGQTLQTVSPISFNAKPRQEINQIQRLGERSETVDSDGPRGYEGEITFQLETLALEDLEDAVIQRQVEGKPVQKLVITQTITVPSTGESRSYMYPNAILVPSTTVASRRDEVKKTYKWESELRQRV